MPQKKTKQKNPRPPSIPPRDASDECSCSCGCECHAPASAGMPTHVLSDVCRRKGWHEPEYSMTQSASGYLATVSMRSTLPSGESIVLPFKAPDSLRAVFTDTEEIAKNNIAMYVLFCIGEHNSDLPRGWRSLWKREFEKIKAVDIKEGRGWMYSADLFRAYKSWQASLLASD
ncbi:hypothetical protein IFM46972_02126 [Aspergillus udagawae]|uniref:ATP-dependent RNA helicase DHX29 DSRM-like domain-containing protein n=1 Tax=Aspergillus udagawae TaxID=91492 RepID=A0A8H3N6D4_9EURO|nr:hypothetical protein IFM46972_02126 [Aspergillus udagawae]